VRRSGILHPELLDVLNRAGHGDVIVLADAGLRIPLGARRVDLALRCSVPSMAETLEAVLGDFVAEAATVADKLAEWNPETEAAVLATLPCEPVGCGNSVTRRVGIRE
jgi:D-ribose pyranase